MLFNKLLVTEVMLSARSLRQHSPQQISSNEQHKNQITKSKWLQLPITSTFSQQLARQVSGIFYLPLHAQKTWKNLRSCNHKYKSNAEHCKPLRVVHRVNWPQMPAGSSLRSQGAEADRQEPVDVPIATTMFHMPRSLSTLSVEWLKRAAATTTVHSLPYKNSVNSAWHFVKFRGSINGTSAVDSRRGENQLSCSKCPIHVLIC